jgi:hypothetical protein
MLPDQVNYWSNYPKFFVSLMKSFYGDAAQKENDWGFDWLPKWDQAYDVIKYFNMMDKGNVTGYICQGFNPVALPGQKQSGAQPEQAEIHGGYRSAGHRNLEFLAEPRRDE